MDYFHQRLLSSVRITEENALKGSLIEKKRKREVAASIREVNQIDYEKAKTMAARIVSDIFSNNKEIERNKPSTETWDDVIQEINMPQTFLSENRHSSTTPEDLSERWGLSLALAELTLKATTQKLNR